LVLHTQLQRIGTKVRKMRVQEYEKTNIASQISPRELTFLLIAIAIESELGEFYTARLILYTLVLNKYFTILNY